MMLMNIGATSNLLKVRQAVSNFLSAAIVSSLIQWILWQKEMDF